MIRLGWGVGFSLPLQEHLKYRKEMWRWDETLTLLFWFWSAEWFVEANTERCECQKEYSEVFQILCGSKKHTDTTHANPVLWYSYIPILPFIIPLSQPLSICNRNTPASSVCIFTPIIDSSGMFSTSFLPCIPSSPLIAALGSVLPDQMLFGVSHYKIVCVCVCVC